MILAMVILSHYRKNRSWRVTTAGENGKLKPYWICLCYTTVALVLKTNSQAQNTLVPMELKHLVLYEFSSVDSCANYVKQSTKLNCLKYFLNLHILLIRNQENN